MPDVESFEEALVDARVLDSPPAELQPGSNLMPDALASSTGLVQEQADAFIREWSLLQAIEEDIAGTTTSEIGY
jgi:hypothetical protein